MADADSTRICSVDGCGNKLKARGYCATHWSRWKRNGSPDIGAREFLSGQCSVDWCQRAARSRFRETGVQYCAMHYLQMSNRGEINTERLEPVDRRTCSVDGCSKEARSRTAALCDMHYQRRYRRGVIGPADTLVVWYEQCHYCGAATAGKKFCNGACAARSHRGNPRTKSCAVCSADFDPRSEHGPDADVCSETCSEERRKAWRRQRYIQAMATPEGRERFRNSEYIRRARKAKAFVEHVSRDEVMRRGKWRCHLCGDPIPKDAKHPDPTFGTVDHVLPLAEGGAHSYANCKPAHLRCNCSKGARPFGQLGLELSA